MKLIANPTVMQLVVMLFVIVGLVVFGVFIARALRRELVTETGQTFDVSPRPETAQFALATYQGVIAGLKSKEQQLLASLAAEKSRASAAEAWANVIIENIGTGVITFSSTLLVKEANPAARRLLGYESPLNMHVKEIFRGLNSVELPSSNGALGGISQALRDVIATGAEYRGIPASYCTPAGENRAFNLELLPLQKDGQQDRAAVCLIGHADTAFTVSLPSGDTNRNMPRSE